MLVLIVKMYGCVSVKLLLPAYLLIRSHADPAVAALNYCSSIRSIQKHVYTIDWIFGRDAPAIPHYTILVAIKMTGPSSNFLDFLAFLRLTRPV